MGSKVKFTRWPAQSGYASIVPAFWVRYSLKSDSWELMIVVMFLVGIATNKIWVRIFNLLVIEQITWFCECSRHHDDEVSWQDSLLRLVHSCFSRKVLAGHNDVKKLQSFFTYNILSPLESNSMEYVGEITDDIFTLVQRLWCYRETDHHEQNLSCSHLIYGRLDGSVWHFDPHSWFFTSEECQNPLICSLHTW